MQNPFKRLVCFISGHQMEISHVVNDRVNEWCCTKCNKQVTNNIYGETVPLNDIYERINKSLAQLARKKAGRPARVIQKAKAA
ncbi:hypothetical protein [Nonlabens agnitus]|nr:hypothetical protein [Nonlabens agnitus]